mgnify:FL=1
MTRFKSKENPNFRLRVHNLDWSRWCVLIAICALLFSCSEENVEWITVPLADNVFFDAEAILRSDSIEIPVPANSDLEYMLDMGGGLAVSYEWTSENLEDPELLLAEFHGHTIRDSEEPGEVMFYKQGRGSESSGYLVAPFDGVHGWDFSNENGSDIQVTLDLSGSYEVQ